MLKGNAIAGQSGGPTSVVNASLAGVIDASRDVDGDLPQYAELKHHPAPLASWRRGERIENSPTLGGRCSRTLE